MLRKAGIAVVTVVLGFTTFAQDPGITNATKALKGKTLEELMEMPVTSVSRRPTRFVESATAIQVITDDDIRRSGALNFPDILRLATGIQVAQADGRTWGITARGFNLTTANKMLVLMDGRSLYTPLFGGVLWDAQDYLLNDIDRIEVIRGPGATMWGANAVNGVINIISKSARETQGTYVSTAIGDELRAYGAVRHGDRIGEHTFFRVYAKYTEYDGLALRSGRDAHDDRQFGQTGFRLDSFQWERNLITLQGDLYHGWNGAARRDDEEIGGGNIITRWTHTFSDSSDLRAQLYYDRVDRQLPHTFTEERHTWDADIQYRFTPIPRHAVVVGLHYRSSGDKIESSRTAPLAFFPERRRVELISAFLQDEITLIPETLGLTVGSKFEQNDFSGFEIQPSARITYTPAQRHTLWSAISRAVRTPSRLDDDVYVFSPPPARTLLVRGARSFEAEEVTAYEAGYRVQPHEIVAFDLAMFYNEYHKLRSQEPRGPTGQPLVLHNNISGEAYGAELGVNVQVLRPWRLHAGYTIFNKDLHRDHGSRDPRRGASEGNDPSHMLVFRSSVDFPGNVEFDTIVRYVDRLPDPFVPSYVALDVRVGWQATENMELSIVGRNLLDDRHPEFGAERPDRREVERAVYARVTWRF